MVHQRCFTTSSKLSNNCDEPLSDFYVGIFVLTWFLAVLFHLVWVCLYVCVPVFFYVCLSVCVVLIILWVCVFFSFFFCVFKIALLMYTSTVCSLTSACSKTKMLWHPSLVTPVDRNYDLSPDLTSSFHCSNHLPQSMRWATTICQLKLKLKTHYFQYTLTFVYYVWQQMLDI